MWCDMYTMEDVCKSFDEMCCVLHYNQEYEGVHPLKFTPISSGHHLGSCNWIIHHKIFNKKIGIMQQSCVRNDFRYPLEMNIKELEKCDVLFIGSIVNENKLPPKSGNDTYSYEEALKQFNEYVNQNSMMGNKVLVPMNPFLFLEILELLILSISPRMMIRIFSGSAEGIKAFSNLNLDYLNKKLQDKILDSSDPFEFDKLKKDSKLEIFTNYTSYQKSKRMQEDNPELILATSSTLRMESGDYSIILTDPQFQSDFVTEPYKGTEDSDDLYDVNCNSLPVVRIPIDPSPTFKQLNMVLKHLSPSIIVAPRRYFRNPSSQSNSDYEESDFGDVKMEENKLDSEIKRVGKCMYKMYEEGEQYFIDLIDGKDEYFPPFFGQIHDKKISSLIEESAKKREEDYNEILRSTATLSLIDNNLKLIQLDPNPTFSDLPSLRDQFQSNLITRILNDTDIQSEEDTIMIYNISETSTKSDLEKLISSVEDRKMTFIQQLKYQDCTVTEIKREESKDSQYAGFELSISPNKSTSDKAITLTVTLRTDIDTDNLPTEETEIYKNYLDFKIDGDSASALKKTTKALIKVFHLS